MNAHARPRSTRGAGLLVAVLVLAQAGLAAAALSFSDRHAPPVKSTIPPICGLALGTSQALLLAGWLTLGATTWREKGLAGPVFVGAYLVAFRLIDEQMTPFNEWLSLVGWWIAAPWLAGLMIGTLARRRGWRWIDAASERAPPAFARRSNESSIRWSVRGMLLGVIAFALVLGAARWLREHGHASGGLVIWLKRSLHGVLEHEAYLNDPLIGMCFCAAAAGVWPTMIGRKPTWSLVPAALGGAALLGAVAWYALPDDLSNQPGLETVWGCGTLTAALNTLIVLLLLRSVGRRVDRVAASPDDSSSSGVVSPPTSVEAVA
ncbi:MAG TPA: hypothetical protein VGE52_14040, partial [Pirellulales bacterium]